MPMWPCLSAVSDNVICGLIDREGGGRTIAYLTCGRQNLATLCVSTLDISKGTKTLALSLNNKFGKICVCVSPTQTKKYAIKPQIHKTYHQLDAL